jgi:uncharacterized phage infection (PIP) family protein YhgE
MFGIIGMGVLALALIAVGFLFFQEMGKVNKANVEVTDLQTNVASLNGNISSLNSQLSTAQSNAADLQSKLTTEQAKSADLQTKLTAAQSDLTANKAQVTSLQSDLTASNGKVTGLTADLATANGKVATIQASLDKATADLATANTSLTKANADLAKATGDLTTANASLNKVLAPRMFTSLTELQNWLAKDDTNTKYYNTGATDRAFILQVRAARDGYLISVHTTWDNNLIYTDNYTIIGNVLYIISNWNDNVTAQTWSWAQAPMVTPLPLGQ